MLHGRALVHVLCTSMLECSRKTDTLQFAKDELVDRNGNDHTCPLKKQS